MRCHGIGCWVAILLAALVWTACSGYEGISDAGQDAIDGQVGGDDGGGGCLEAYPGQVVINEIFMWPVGVAAPVACFLEIVNTSSEPLALEGWTLMDGEGHSVALELPAGLFLQPASPMAIALSDDAQSESWLSPGLVIDQFPVEARLFEIWAGEVMVDRVDLRTGLWPLVDGASLSLDPEHQSFMGNDEPEHWCQAEVAFAGNLQGSPGEINPSCPTPVLCVDPTEDCTDIVGDCLDPYCLPVEEGQGCGQQTADDPPTSDNPCLLGVCNDDLPGFADRPGGTACELAEPLPGSYCVEGACLPPECGDNVRGPLEGCDDGGREDGDGCSADCELEGCGDGEFDEGEDCDDGKNGDDADGCRDDCRFSCLDPLVDCKDPKGDCAMQVCVEGGFGRLCQAEQALNDIPIDDGEPCTLERCSDLGLPEHAPLDDGAACDNGVGRVGDYCRNALCIDPVCGDRVVGPLEDCDDGNLDPCDACLPDCTARNNACGDGFFCPEQEDCEDGNLADGDGCSASCELEHMLCPADMVHVPADALLGVPNAFCMDRYEASRSDATFLTMGHDLSRAVSQPNVIPWHYNPISIESLGEFQLACEAVGKRLCGREEWYAACTGPERHDYCYGDFADWDKERCNCVDTHCDDVCEAWGLDPCDDASGCGYRMYYDGYASFYVMPTGYFSACVDSFGGFDMSGNVWEMVPSDVDPNLRGYEIRGGAFNCGGPTTRLQCNYNASWNSLYAGFRCCSDSL